jgi:DNA-binding LytR/AlgR family response regulator
MKDALTCFVIDDEPLAEEILCEYIKKVSFLKLAGSFSSALDASAAMEHDKPDLLFLDINMPDLDGLSFISMLNPKPNIILTTAYDQYAVKAFELEVNDYLVKPISFERFYKSVLRLHQNQKNKEESEEKEKRPTLPSEKDSIFIQSGTRIQKINIKDILLIEGMKDYLRIHTVKDKIMTLLTFAKLEELLPPGKFCRVHKSFMVAIDKIDHVEKNRIKIGDQIIPVSDTYAEKFFKILKG